MAYDNTSLTGDEICDYYYDIENNLVNPESPSGYFIYKIIGGAFDWLNDLIVQFRIDYSILDCNVGDVEIVKSFPEEADTNHTYYVHQPNTSTDACFTKYSYVDGEWVSETVTGDVLNSLDVFWGRSYNLPRPSLPYLYTVVKSDKGILTDYSDIWSTNTTSAQIKVTRTETYTEFAENSANNFANRVVGLTENSIIEFDYYQVDGGYNPFMYILDYSNTQIYAGGINLSNFNANVGEWYHFKISFNNGTMTMINETTNTTITRSYTSIPYLFSWWSSSTITAIRFKNFKIYDIVYPILFRDGGVTGNHNDNWYNQNSSFTRTRTNNATNLKITSPSGTQAYFAGGSGTWASTKLYTAPLSVEFEITEITTGTPNFEIRGDNTYFTWTCSNIGSYRVEITGTKVKKYLNGTIDAEYDMTMNEIYSIGFRQNASTEFKYKNFVIYNSESPVYSTRLLSDDEYRIYLYLKNHQLLTMKDLLVAFSNAFGSAETSTTLLNSIHTVGHKTYDNPPFSNDSLRAYDDEDMDITTDKLVDKDGVNLINNRLAQGTTSILIPDDGWDEQFLRFLESFISIKGNILISVGG